MVSENRTLCLQGGRQIGAMPQLQNLESITIKDKQTFGRTMTRICLCLLRPFYQWIHVTAVATQNNGLVE